MGPRTFKSAIAALLLTLAFVTGAKAVSDNVKNLKFGNFQNSDYSLSYGIVRDAMKDLYKNLAPDNNPLIGIAEEDLNGDNSPEMISYPLEEEEEYGLYCSQKNMCPYYILQDRGDKIRTLAVIYADSIDRGDKIVNGYYTLLAYQKEQAGSDESVTYIYDKEKDGYVPQVSQGPPPEKTTKPKP